MLGKASSSQMENLHGRVANMYDMALTGLADEHEDALKMEEQLAETENREVRKMPFRLSKDDLAMLTSATKFLKDNDVSMDVQKKSGSKKFSSTVQEMTAKKKKEALLYG